MARYGKSHKNKTIFLWMEFEKIKSHIYIGNFVIFDNVP